LIDVGLVPTDATATLSPQQEGHVTALRNRVVAVVEEFSNKNQLPTATTKGTARNTIAAMKGFLTLFQPFVQPGVFRSSISCYMSLLTNINMR
jgi:hypothetical protein